MSTMNDVRQHTPGPWRVGCGGSAIVQWIYTEADHHPIASVYAGSREESLAADPSFTRTVPVRSPLELQANADLITAAPDMYAVLRGLEWIGLNDGRGVTQAMCPACSALKSRGSGHNPYCGLAAALAKAEGR